MTRAASSIDPIHKIKTLSPRKEKALKLKLFLSAIVKVLLGVLLVGLLLFLPAGTLFYTRGLILMGVLFIPMFFAGIVLLVKNPALLSKRLSAKEKLKSQDVVIKLSGLMFLSSFILAGLGHRFGWFTLPFGISIGATVTFIIAYILYAEVLRENTYLSRTIEVQENQKVVDTGLYGLVRHPMYFVTLILFLSMPLILGSLYSLAIMLLYPFLISKRIKDEERFLAENLNGYKDYMKKVKYRLIPFIW